MKLFIILFLCGNILLNAATNVSLIKVLSGLQGDEYNVLLAPKQIVISGKKNKTRQAIHKGYKRAIMELKRQVKLRNMHLNLKIFTPKGSTMPQYAEKDAQSYQLLKKMLEQQVSIREQLLSDSNLGGMKSIESNKKVSAEEIDVEIDFDDSAFDISADSASIQSNDGSALTISPAESFRMGFIDISRLYNQEVLQLHKALHPFKIQNMPTMKNIHSIFGMAFFPTKYGRVKVMKIYLVLCNINTETKQSVQVIAKEIPEFKWSRNYLYISAATGKVLRQIVSGVLGESFENLK